MKKLIGILAFLSFAVTTSADTVNISCNGDGFSSCDSSNPGVLLKDFSGHTALDLGDILIDSLIDNIDVKIDQGATPWNMRVSLEHDKEIPVDINVDLSSKKSSELTAGNFLLVSDYVKDLNVKLDGFQGEVGKNISETCAKEFVNGTFGSDAKLFFEGRRSSDQNLSLNRCVFDDALFLLRNNFSCEGVGFDEITAPYQVELEKFVEKMKCTSSSRHDLCIQKTHEVSCLWAKDGFASVEKFILLPEIEAPGGINYDPLSVENLCDGISLEKEQLNQEFDKAENGNFKNGSTEGWRLVNMQFNKSGVSTSLLPPEIINLPGEDNDDLTTPPSVAHTQEDAVLSQLVKTVPDKKYRMIALFSHDAPIGRTEKLIAGAQVKVFRNETKAAILADEKYQPLGLFDDEVKGTNLELYQHPIIQSFGYHSKTDVANDEIVEKVFVSNFSGKTMQNCEFTITAQHFYCSNIKENSIGVNPAVESVDLCDAGIRSELAPGADISNPFDIKQNNCQTSLLHGTSCSVDIQVKNNANQAIGAYIGSLAYSCNDEYGQRQSVVDGKFAIGIKPDNNAETVLGSLVGYKNKPTQDLTRGKFIWETIEGISAGMDKAPFTVNPPTPSWDLTTLNTTSSASDVIGKLSKLPPGLKETYKFDFVFQAKEENTLIELKPLIIWNPGRFHDIQVIEFPQDAGFDNPDLLAVNVSSRETLIGVNEKTHVLEDESTWKSRLVQPGGSCPLNFKKYQIAFGIEQLHTSFSDNGLCTDVFIKEDPFNEVVLPWTPTNTFVGKEEFGRVKVVCGLNSDSCPVKKIVQSSETSLLELSVTEGIQGNNQGRGDIFIYDNTGATNLSANIGGSGLPGVVDINLDEVLEERVCAKIDDINSGASSLQVTFKKVEWKPLSLNKNSLPFDPLKDTGRKISLYKKLDSSVRLLLKDVLIYGGTFGDN
jgi:hypothetical protein